MNQTLNISGITLNPNVDYLNVHNYGDINVVNVNLSTYEMYISGLSKYLSVDRYIKNSLNDGNIVFAEMSGSGNIYISGFVNFNKAGDLHEIFQSPTQPIANEGIINSVNSGDISTSFGVEFDDLYGINGTSNTFIGGITTLNSGSIQNASNLGNISAYNSTQNSYFYPNNDEDEYYAGLIYGYDSGIVAGGIAAIAISGNSRIYDTANNGDVIVAAEKYVRSGGILGVALWREADAGGITSTMGLENTIQNSILSNGLNFGDISAISSTIASYTISDPLVTKGFYLRFGSTTNYEDGEYYTVQTVEGNDERPPIYSSAGGVIGYGLSVMQRMLNHGVISATDVAGGIAGATYVLGGSTSPVTTVNITTAINYGEIKSIDDADYGNIDMFALNSDEISLFYMLDGNDFIYPTHMTPESPGAKRGFGGIFGRLQRGTNGSMTSATGAFNFIVNANDQIDLIGRLDQVDNFSSSLRYFRFNDAIYYSAKINDTTQVVFTGIYFEVYKVTNRESRNPYIYTYDTILAEQVGIVMTEENLLASGNTDSSYTYYRIGDYLSADYISRIEVPWITEDPNDINLTEDWTDPLLENEEREYIYGPYFPMRTETNLTEYIYYAEYDLLADRFRKVEDEGLGTNIRENGMYVLSTTAGQEFGEVLPRNINPSAIELINEDLDLMINNLDYGNLAPSQTINLSETIIDKYEALYQTRYNDKAELTDSELQNITLHENNGGSNTVLSSPEINYATKEITYTISMEAFDPLQETASFNIFDALTSANALIAVRPEDYYPTDELIISEYIEGSSFNKSIEIYNGTKSDVDLSAYSIEIYYNGSTSAGNTISLSGTLLSGHTYVVSNTSADQEILALSDLITGSVQHNGNDAVALLKNGVAIDVFGVIGVDPGTGWDVDGITGQDTADHTLVRKPTVSSPNTTFTGSEWIIYDVDTFDYLGMHNLDVISDYLYPERYDEISTLYPPLLEVDLPAYNISSDTTLSLGYFSIYSEAFVNNSIFAKNMYYNNYQIKITFTPNMNETTGTSGIQSVSFNGGASINLSTTTEYIDPQPLSIDITGRGNVNYNGSLTLNFNDQKSFLNEGYDFKEFFKLYYLDGTNEVEVDASYYSISSTPVTAGGLYQIVFVFDDALLKTGDYIIKYSYFSASTEYEVLFDKAPSNQVAVIDFDYYSMNDQITFNGTSITSYINMGKIPDIDTTTNNYTTNTMEISNPLYEVFLSTTTYDISFMYSDSFMISPFAEVTRAQLMDTTYSGGYVTYIIEYDITAEDGVTEETYTHTIVERAVSLTAAYKDGNDVPLENITTTREALSTRFEIDLGFDTSIDMSGPVEYSVNTSDPAYLEISVSGIEPKEVPLDPDVPITNIVGLTYSANNYLIIDMSAETLPGTYTFIITYNRGTTIGNIVFASLEITKFEGTSAYISDIKFTPIASESTYPTIDIVDSFGGDITQIYDPSIYFFGIDYDGADDNYYQYFKINGKVNNIPLESYYPYILDYLPLGATISRWDTTTSDWTAEVSDSSTDLEKSVLAADYTEIVGNENIAIKYRVKSEDGNSEVYYYISVNDILYNVTLIFDIYYCDDQEVCVLAKSTEDFTEVIQINVYNLYIDSNDMSGVNPAYSENNPLYYRTFSKVSGLYNSMSHYIYTDSTNYNYRFGRNRSGFYIFEVILPIDEYLNEMYTYEIMIDGYTLDDLDDLTYTSNINLNGKYYYIDFSENNRTRRFDIKISRTTVSGDKPFGLFDYFRTWS
ncbi:MAG: lamin tail domain-containing protein [Candidatus Izemoplasmatales bacterium]|nr:lamin tail domain-containing protein [Candidatus Izemoplasmatales bacterium]